MALICVNFNKRLEKQVIMLYDPAFSSGAKHAPVNAAHTYLMTKIL
jgi:hypothetical protein